MIFIQVWKIFFSRDSRSVERFSVRISAENHVLLVLESHMGHNRSKTTCNLPGTLVGHSKITISLLNSAWFARYSGFLVGSILVTNTPHRRLVSVVGGGGGGGGEKKF